MTAPPLASVADISRHVALFDPGSFLERIAEVSSLERSDHPVARWFPTAVNPWVLGDLARYVLRYGDWTRARPAQLDDVMQGVNLVNGIAGIPEAEHDHTDTFLFLYRTANQQFPYQGDPTQRIARMLVMNVDLPRSIPRLAGYDIPQRFHQVTGVTIEQFAWVVFGLWTMAQRGRAFHPQQLIGGDLGPLAGVITPEAVEAVSHLFAMTPRELAEAAEKEAAAVSGDVNERFAMNPLIQTPIIRLDRDRLVIPVPQFLIRQVVDAPYYVLLRADGKAFLDHYGAVLEEYVGWLLRPYCGERLRSEITYGRAAERRRGSDWVVLEDGAAALIECKTGRMPKAEKTTAAFGPTSQRFQAMYAQASRQLQRFARDIAVHGELADLREREIGPFIVVLDPIYLANSPMWADARDTVAKDLGLDAAFRPEVMSVEALEELAPLLATRSMVQLLKEKRRAERPDPPRHWDWEQYAQHQGADGNPHLAARWDRAFAELEPSEKPG